VPLAVENVSALSAPEVSSLRPRRLFPQPFRAWPPSCSNPRSLQLAISQRSKSVWRAEKLAFQSSRFTVPLPVPKRDQPHHRLLPPSDDDLLAPASPLNQSRKVCLGFVDGYSFHRRCGDSQRPGNSTTACLKNRFGQGTASQLAEKPDVARDFGWRSASALR